MTVPMRPKIYHIVHIDRLPSIIKDGLIWCDAQAIARSSPGTIIGMNEIKQNRLKHREVKCHPSTMVGDYVPFYFCPRSVMLYILHRGNHPSLEYTGGQQPIVHLQADLKKVVQACNKHNVQWAFTDRNAATAYARFYNDLKDLGEINWGAVGNHDFREEQVSEGKQAEFLVYHSFPWWLVEKIGVIDEERRRAIEICLRESEHKPMLKVERAWYY